MQRHPVGSRSIASVGYDPESLVLEVEFHTGRVYQYRGVPADVHQELLAADSIGAYLAHSIKPHYPASETR